MKKFIIHFLAIFMLFNILVVSAAPRIVVSIQPLYALVTGLMAGVDAQPTLLVPPGASPHYYALRPSEAKALYEADMVIWVGEGLETFLVKPLSQLPATTERVTLLDFPITHYPIRSELLWQETSSSHSHVHTAEPLKNTSIDPHIWLDPLNAIVITEGIAALLKKQDPIHAAQYENNKIYMINRLKKLNLDVTQQLQSVQTVPFIVFHDAYQYFERRYHLNALGAITLHADTMPSPKRIQQIREILNTHHVRCVFREPQFTSRLVDIITENTTVKQGVLDPIGETKSPGIQAYERLIRNLSQSLHDCL